MSNVFTLDALKEETQKKFAPVVIGMSDGSEVKLSSVLRLPKESRKLVSTTIEQLDDLEPEEDDPASIELLTEALSKVFNVIADKPAKLLKELDDEDPMVKLHLMGEVIGLWIGETQLGEASNSPA
ncbi:phage tail assembly protein [Mycobacterium avium]|uniref:phage tail assembly protein n=1 Tax=Mycobacterium avium TaxID=1764 RepID=UPI001CDB415A|nr:phage tail assembly protein [Mycobacterium avium]MCA2331638.1 phage tail assembly protein [Mycobacterium avium]